MADSRASASYPRQAITGLILAGGQGNRMSGADKGWVSLAGRPMIDWVISRLLPQVGKVLISANRNQPSYQCFGYPVFGDDLPNQQGPLAGLAAGFARLETPWMLVIPCDAPLLPWDLGPRLIASAQTVGARLAVAHDDERMQPAFLLAHRDVRAPLEVALAAGERRLGAWVSVQRPAIISFSGIGKAWRGANTEAELAALTQAFVLSA